MHINQIRGINYQNPNVTALPCYRVHIYDMSYTLMKIYYLCMTIEKRRNLRPA